MGAQVRRGHAVAYFLSGRQYPYVSGPRLKRWRRSGVEMFEVINPPIVAGVDFGTRDPERELSEPRMEAAFERTLARVRPDVVHIQELMGLPSSLIDVAGAAGVPTVMTLQDYGPLCTTLRLFDSDGRICMRREVGADCVARNAAAPADARPLVYATIEFEIARLRRLLRLGPRVDFSLFAPVVGKVFDRVTRSRANDDAPLETSPATADATDESELAAAFQRRRDVNVERLGRVDRLVAQSSRVAEIYKERGVAGDRMTTLRFTLAHIEALRPRAAGALRAPLTFATINGCSAPSKGSRTMLAALRALRAAGAGDQFRLRVFGYLDPAISDELAAFGAVELSGRYSSDQLDALLDGVDVGIMPSMWEEALGYTGLEFLAKGIPLIANPLGGIVEYAREGQTAWLNRSCSGEELAELMLRLIRDPAEVAAMQRRVAAAREEVVIPLSRHVDAVDELYRELSVGAA